MKRIKRTAFGTCELPTYEGETLETKVKRVVENNEPITDGAPLIFTPKKEGVIAGYNIRTDRWDIAMSAMDAVNKDKYAKATEWMVKQAEDKVKEDQSTGAKPATTDSQAATN